MTGGPHGFRPMVTLTLAVGLLLLVLMLADGIGRH